VYKFSKLQVTNFRNLLPNIIEFCPGINCILGENGNGKTNILEALYVIATKKSFRKNTSFPQYLSMNCEEPQIIFSSVISDEKNNVSYSAKIDPNSSQFFVNGKITKKRPELKLVFINPFDSYGFHNSASSRRSWFDTYIGLLEKQYKTVLNKYNKLLRFRNSLLSKKPNMYREQIQALDTDFAKYSVILTKRRLEFLSEIEIHCKNTFKSLFSEDHVLKVTLDSKFAAKNELEILEYLHNNLQKDEIIGHTHYGVHKDDYPLLFDGINSFEFCSLGQQKMSYLSLIFAYIELFRYKYVAYPVVLIDDVSGELDQIRWRRLIEYLEQRDFQVFITTANEKFSEELEKISGAKKIYVEAGSIK
jgi:DNA replication and repair protein RecF